MKTWYEDLAQTCQNHGRMRVIEDHEKPGIPYLNRYYPLFPQGCWFQGFNLVLHNFLRSDGDDLHDHPWPYVTHIVAGGYWENTIEGRFWRKAGDTLARSAKHLHSVHLEPSAGPVWTLFLMGPRIREWGFLENGRQWQAWQTHLTRRNPTPHV